MKIVPGDLWLHMLQRLRRLEADPRPHERAIPKEVVAAHFDARQRLLELESLAHKAGLLPPPSAAADAAREVPRPLELSMRQGLVDDINQQEQKFPGRLWESGSVDGVAYIQEFLKHLATSGDPRQASAAASSSLGLVERFEPTLDDIEKALAQWGPGQAGLVPVYRQKQQNENERLGEILRYIIIIGCFSVIAVAVSAAL